MKIAIFSDLHAHPWQEHAKPHDRCSNDRLWDCVSVIAEIGLYCHENKITKLVFGGDLFHKRGVVYTETWNLVRNALVNISEKFNLTIVMNDGNHDQANKSGTVTAIQSLASERIEVVAGHACVGVSLGKDVVLHTFPYADSRLRFDDSIQHAEKQLKHLGAAHNIALFHHGFKGARVGSSLEYVVKEEIDASVLDGMFNAVFSGHYHTRQDIEGCTGASYIGSPLQHTRTDRRRTGGQQKGFLVYSTTTGKTKFVPLKRPEFVQLIQKDLDKAMMDVEVEGNFVDVMFHDYPGGKEAIEKELKEKGARGYLVEQVREQGKKETAAPRMVVDPSLDTKTLLKKYVKHHGTELDTDALVTLGMELIGKAQK